jgi:polyisoprenyl-teichoic acid--peptidoglycan teichoic acid transferase
MSDYSYDVKSVSDSVLSEPRAPRRRWFGTPVKLVLGCLLVVLASAGGTAMFILEQVHTVVQDLRANRPLVVDRKALAPDYYGGPETLLLVGDDWRPATKYYPHAVPHLANEMLLVRIDPSKPYISMMSIPRELWVPIATPNGEVGPTRLNAAYTGGLTYLLETIKQVTGLSINHVIVATFGRFEKAIDTLGCVYSTIDERYYHNNADGGDQYQNIDLQPGYQCLNGSEAEQFVSYRHTDTSQIRDARDQAFLLDVKKQYGPELAGNVGKFEKIFGQTVQTDPGLDTPTEVLNLADLLISAAGLRVRQVPFSASPLPSGDLTATPQQIKQSVHNFLVGGGQPPTGQTAKVARKVGRRAALAHLPLTPTLAANVAAEKAALAGIPFTAEFPKVQDLGGSGAFGVARQCTPEVEACIRDYLIHAPDGKAYPIYVEVFSNGQLGQFYDVQGTTWTDAPLFADPNQTTRVGKRSYDLYYDGTQLQMVAWHEHGAWYWIHNTLTNGVDNGELLAIAEQTEPIGAIVATPGAGSSKHVILKAAAAPAPTVATPKTPLTQTIGSLAGLAALVLAPLLAIMILRQRRMARQAQVQLQTNLELAASVSAAIPAALAVPAAPARATPGPYTDRHDYRSRRGRATILLPSVAVVLAAATAGYLATRARGHTQQVPAAVSNQRLPDGPPTVSVAVLDASRQPGAAASLAQHLAARRVHIIATGSVSESRAPGYWILYVKGAKAQAEKLAAMLNTPPPRIASIDLDARAAAGPRAEVVVVIV